MGNEICIDNLARNMIEQAGYHVVEKGQKKSKDEIEIHYLGLRAGEKECEKLSYEKFTSEGDYLNLNEDILPTDDLIAHIYECVTKCHEPKWQEINWKTGCLM
jgi:FlaA1/EpsC-like NDP-sugar epimerase